VACCCAGLDLQEIEIPPALQKLFSVESARVEGVGARPGLAMSQVRPALHRARLYITPCALRLESHPMLRNSAYMMYPSQYNTPSCADQRIRRVAAAETRSDVFRHGS
jgi:hypothetical protein